MSCVVNVKSFMVEIWGLKPQTSALPGQRSNQLSYIPKECPNEYTKFAPDASKVVQY